MFTWASRTGVAAGLQPCGPSGGQKPVGYDVRKHWLVGVASAVMSAMLVASGARQVTAELVVVEPGPDTVLRGPVVLKAQVTPETTAVQDVTFFVDGREACRATARPLQCQYDAGSSDIARSIRVVATLSNGERIVKAFRTSPSRALFRSAVDAVVVSVHVADDRKRFVQGLQQADFQILEDGKAQEITSSATEDAKTDILLALDVSGSMTSEFGELKKAVRAFLSGVRPQDSVTLAAFTTNLWVVAPASATPDARLAALDALSPGGGTSLYDAMVRGANLLKPRTGRRVLVMFTDGDDVSSRTSSDAAPAALQDADTMLYIVAQGRASKDEALQKQLMSLAGGTGGSAFFAPHMSDLHEHFTAILQDISEQYLLTYRPERSLGDGQWRQIAVTTANKKNKIRARQGYFATARGGGRP